MFRDVDTCFHTPAAVPADWAETTSQLFLGVRMRLTP